VPDRRSVAIVGGGIAGLSAAYWLLRNRPSIEITLLESRRRLGGVIATEHCDGFVIEGGPDSFLARKTPGIALCRALGIEQDLVPAIPENRGSFVALDGALHALPEGLSGLIPMRIEAIEKSPLFSEGGKERFAREPDVPLREGNEDESLASFVERRFGSEAYSHLIEPLMAGIYAGDGRELSLGATFPQLRDLERKYGSVLRGLAASSSAGSGGGERLGFLTPLRGMGEVVASLVTALRTVELRLGTEVREVQRRVSGFRLRLADGEHLDVDRVIAATPAHASAEILSGLDVDLAHELAGVPHVSTATVSLGFRREDVPSPLHGYGYIIPRISGSPVLACTWVSSKYPNRAPPECVLLRGFVGRRGQEEAAGLESEELVTLLREELRLRLGIEAEPTLERVYHWPKAMPQYVLGHPERIAGIETLCRRQEGLELAGNAYQGIGVPDCIASGEKAATQAAS
jgi:oxygen-dependent protoporphyrinogen oxidase